ncbi:MAG TPA: large conductance mechanosensitive channel protein MscL [Candidatus Eremiobacteraeota bacterium]|nr:large conductance mechanosensitive channel protein MscL [Candidatus Eremiobacteraeota bacterium]
MLKEFKEFIMRGNVFDMAVGIIIGGAFGKIVNSLVNDIIMPPFGLILGKVNFKDLYLNLSGQAYDSLDTATKAGAPVLKYGLFINTILEFLIIAIAIFFMIKVINKLNRQKEAPPPPPDTKDCPYCFSKIAIKATKCPNCTSEIKAA